MIWGCFSSSLSTLPATPLLVRLLQNQAFSFEDAQHRVASREHPQFASAFSITPDHHVWNRVGAPKRLQEDHLILRRRIEPLDAVLDVHSLSFERVQLRRSADGFSPHDTGQCRRVRPTRNEHDEQGPAT